MAHNFEAALYLMAIGMGVVFSALLLLQACTTAISALDRLARRPSRHPAAPPPAEGPSEEEAAAIVAAASAALARRVEVHHIRMIHDENMEAWSRLGRLDIMHSHDRGAGNR
jgi:sodium pump decarboxylase gamma subunit